MGVIGTILGAVWYATGNAKEIQRENDAVQELQATTQNMLALMQGQNLPATVPCSGTSDITCSMITAQVIPSTYVDAQAPTTSADNPWSLQGFHVYSMGTKTFRLSYYNVSQQGCMALLSQMTACQFGQLGCPAAVYSLQSAKSCTPTNCDGTVSAGAAGWQALTSAKSSTLCGYNSYTGGVNSLEFDMSL
jgi:hypothetical protein